MMPPSTPRSMVEGRSTVTLPPELWAHVFQDATSMANFFDARWDSLSGSVITAFDESPQAHQSTIETFASSLRTKKAISLVCKDWRKLSWELIYSHIVIRRKSQLSALVLLLEQSRPKTASDPHGLGWHVTHIKLLIVGAGHDEDRRSGTEMGARETVPSAPEGRYVEPENDSTANLVKRLLFCCPRLQVFLDAAPYAVDEIPRSVLPSISNAFTRLAGAGETSSSSFSLLPNGDDEHSQPASQIRSLEWGYGSPSISDLLDPAHSSVIHSVRSLRCTAIVDPNWIFSTVQGTLRRIPYMQQLPPALLALHSSSSTSLSETGSELLSMGPKSLREQPLLMFSKLVSLDMFISARSHMHWPILVSATTTSIAGSSVSTTTSTDPAISSGTGLPSLTHLTIRTPSSLGTILGPEAIVSLHVFLKAYGAQLKSLDLRISPGDVDPNARLPPPPDAFHGMPMNAQFGGVGNGNGNGAAGLLNIPLVLARCPNLEDLVLSSRWPSPHSNDAVGPTATMFIDPNLPNPNGLQQQQEPQNGPNPSPFAIPHHEKLRRIGFRDTAPAAEGFSSSLANKPCPSCRRVHMLSSATDAGRGSENSAGNGSASGELPYRPQTSPSNQPASPSANSATPRPSLLSLASALALPASSISAPQHPFPSTLIDSLLSGALVGNAMHDATNNGVGTHMNHRHCTIDRHFRMILSGARVLGEPEPYLPPFVREGREERGSGAVADMLAAADRALFGEDVGLNGGARRVPSQNEQDILRRKFGAMPRFPNLEVVQLLDSKPSMFSNAKPAHAPPLSLSSSSSPTPTPSVSPYARSSLSLPPPLPHTNSVSGAATSCSTTCWCIPYESRVEMNFWGAWAARSESRGIKLLDRDGHCLNPVYAVSSSSSTSSAASSIITSTPSPYSLSTYAPPAQLGTVKVENLDLEEELNVSIIRAALTGSSSGVLRISAPIRPFIDTYSAVSTLLSLTLRSKGPSDMTTREVAERLLIWFAEHGIISMTIGMVSGFRDCISTVQFLLEKTRLLRL